MLASNIASKLCGKVMGIKFPKVIQKGLNKAYVSLYKLDLSEFKDYKEYDSLNALFTRSLVKERTIEDGFISPSDGKVLGLGTSFKADNENLAFSIKGFTYNINELLGDGFKGTELDKNLNYLNLYLSPKDYHHYHSPCDMQILSATYIPGRLFCVCSKAIKNIPNLYTRNERVVLKCKKDKKLFWMVFVGALNVGKMNFVFDEKIKTNAKNNATFTQTYENLKVKKGDELGYFELGSSIVLITWQDLLTFTCKKDEEIKFGKSIAEFKA